MGRSRKQKHGPATVDGKGRTGSSASSDMIPRQAISSAKHHQYLAEREAARIAARKRRK
jgi:hypothetical protein